MFSVVHLLHLWWNVTESLASGTVYSVIRGTVSGPGPTMTCAHCVLSGSYFCAALL